MAAFPEETGLIKKVYGSKSPRWIPGFRDEGHFCRYVEGLKPEHVRLELAKGKEPYSTECHSIGVHEPEVVRR